MADVVARLALVSGQVQGVFFRDTTRRVARELGVVGWVSNEPDGTVRAHVQGAPAAVEQVLRFLRHGPPEASVDRVAVTEARIEPMQRFEIR